MTPRVPTTESGTERSQRETPKIQRWVDLLAALLTRQWPATFDDVARGVPEYADESRDLETRKRMFERDKDELRAFGVPIETVAGDEQLGYRLRKADFYLPYLALADTVSRAPDAHPAVDRIDRWGYQALRALAFEPEELQAVVEAAARARQLGAPALATDAASAVRKLAFDLPVDGVALEPVTVVVPRPRADPRTLDALGEALLARKVVTFRYHVYERDDVATRTVEPWGLFFLGGHWYLAARDPQRGEGRAGLRNFRVSRMADLSVNGKQAATPDYEVPSAFRLREHARTQLPWALGEGDEEEVVVEFRTETGATLPAARLGESEPGDPRRRRFRVRRRDALVRWLLTFTGDAHPVSPAAVVEAYEEQVRRTRDLYACATLPDAVSTAGATPPRPQAPGQPRRATPDTAAAQLRRILDVVPRIADGEPHAVEEVARDASVTPRTLLRDLMSLSSRLDAPGGFVEGLSILMEPGVVEVHTPHFLRPMGLTAGELRALELGLAVLALERRAEELRAVEGARARLREVLGRRVDESTLDRVAAGAAAPLDEAGIAMLAVLREARMAGAKVRMRYLKAHATTPEERTIAPYALVVAAGRWYVVARCDASDALRVFRLDRIAAVDPAGAGFTVPDDFDVQAVLREGRVFVTDSPPRTLAVRYGPRVARWVAEREERPLDADGSLTVHHPLADVDWAVRHVLQYGPDAEVLAPEDVRAALRDRIDAQLAHVAAITTATIEERT